MGLETHTRRLTRAFARRLRLRRLHPTTLCDSIKEKPSLALTVQGRVPTADVLVLRRVTTRFSMLRGRRLLLTGDNEAMPLSSIANSPPNSTR